VVVEEGVGYRGRVRDRRFVFGKKNSLEIMTAILI
jgi:hypothetical protein